MKMWSKHLVPKPKDWGSHIDVSGFFFDEDLKIASTDDENMGQTQKTGFIPSPELNSFLSSGSPAIFVGFGSMVVDDAAALVQVLLDCAALLNVRIIVQSGWSGISAERFHDMCQIAEHMAKSSDSAWDDASGTSSVSAIARFLKGTQI